MLVVQKFGGATLASPAQIRAAAERIHKQKLAGHGVVAIVSAMGQTTNELLALANKVSSRPSLRELDMLLTTGERVSMALLAMALHDLGCDSISFTGSQAGILTDESHVNALITDVKAFRVQEALAAGKVVVLAGFQGVSPLTKEITTLGRGGTDTTAVAMSIYLEAGRCEILKEVPAVFTADPRIVNEARPLQFLTYAQLSDMCFWGAKVLHYRSIELAARHELPLYVGPAVESGGKGTTLVKNNEAGVTMPASQFESTNILALNSHEKVIVWRARGGNLQALREMQTLFGHEQIPVPQILNTETREGHTELTLTGPSEVMDQIETLLGRLPADQAQAGLSTVTCTCTGTTSLGLIEKISSHLENEQFHPLRISVSSQSLSLLVLRTERVRILKSLHQLIPES